MSRSVVTAILIAALVAVGVLVLVNRRKKKDVAPAPVLCPDFTPQYTGEPNVKEGKPDMGELVFLGDYGANVAYLQQRLNDAYGASLVVDGKAGCDTFYAVNLFTGLDLNEGVDLNDLK
jgi:hypothetical protein